MAPPSLADLGLPAASEDDLRVDDILSNEEIEAIRKRAREEVLADPGQHYRPARGEDAVDRLLRHAFVLYPFFFLGVGVVAAECHRRWRRPGCDRPSTQSWVSWPAEAPHRSRSTSWPGRWCWTGPDSVIRCARYASARREATPRGRGSVGAARFDDSARSSRA